MMRSLPGRKGKLEAGCQAEDQGSTGLRDLSAGFHVSQVLRFIHLETCDLGAPASISVPHKPIIRETEELKASLDCVTPVLSHVMPVTMSPLAIILPGTQCPQSGLGAYDKEGTGGGCPHRPLEPVVNKQESLGWV